MQIIVTTGTGIGRTPLAAFDQALLTAGIANFNLLALSSVIPGGAEIVRAHPELHNVELWGDRLYVVLAQDRQVEHGRLACAGIGWIQNSESGRGLFVEHHGPSELSVETQIADSLETMRASRGETFGAIETAVISIECGTQPVCALVAAVFRSEPW